MKKRVVTYKKIGSSAPTQKPTQTPGQPPEEKDTFRVVFRTSGHGAPIPEQTVNKGAKAPAPESRAEDILKIRYVIRPFDVETMSCHTRDVYELYPDGKVTYSLYEKGERKPRRKTETHTASGEDYRALCRELNACIASARPYGVYRILRGGDAFRGRPAENAVKRKGAGIDFRQKMW